MDSIYPAGRSYSLDERGKKLLSNSDTFCQEYIINRKNEIQSHEHYSFLLGYYTHLITDASFQKFIQNENRIKDTWVRIKKDKRMRKHTSGYPEDWNSIKQLISKNSRMREIYSMEAEYLQANPNSGYLTEIMTLKEFPDYIDYLPQGCIVRKIGIMGYLPKVDKNLMNPIVMSRDEFYSFANNTALLIINQFKTLKLVR